VTAPFSYAPAPGFHDEAVRPGGEPRAAYGKLLARIAEIGVAGLAERVAAEADATGVAFGGPDGTRPFHVDPVPRLITAGEWAHLEAGVAQRARALEGFVADVYGDQQIVAAGVVPAHVIETCDRYEPAVAELPAPPVRIGVAGLDIVRGGDGVMRVLEDNVRTPSGIAYLLAARASVAAALPDELAGAVRPLDDAFGPLGRTLRTSEGTAVLLSDGPSNSAWYEHVLIAGELGIPLVTLGQLEVAHGCLRALIDGAARRVDVVYRRTDEDRLTDAGGAITGVAAALQEPLRAGTLTCVNGFGTGVADDKLVHAYVEDMIGFYLGEQPLLPSVHTYDLTDADVLGDVLDRIEELVIKPRTGHGGHGVVVGPHADVADLRNVAQAVRRDPHDYVAQDTILLSRHPTVIDGRLEPRHVDLRPFAYLTPDGAEVLPGGLTRVALDPGALVVNSSQAGGGKDTWVLW
jgi:uncharacterized circularly permuted ATP-grasp superfamily protein